MCLSVLCLLRLLSEAPGSMKPAIFLNDECEWVPLQGRETYLISAERGGWYWKSSGILPAPILKPFILIAWMNWMFCFDKSSLAPRELCKWSIADSFCSCCMCMCARKSFSDSSYAVADCLFTQAKTLFTMLTCNINSILTRSSTHLLQHIK